MDIQWDKIKKSIEDKDEIAIAKARTEVLDCMEKQADSAIKTGGSLPGITASTFHWNESALKKNELDLILQFKQALLYSFMQKHGMSIYRDTSSIKKGDAIVIKRNKLLAYDVIAVAYPNISIRLVKFTQGDTPTDIETIKISKRNFIFGIGFNKDIFNICQKLFFFFYNKI